MEWLAGSGLDAGHHGLVVDEFLRAGPSVVAAGDVVAFPRPEGRGRAPYWQNAFDQAVTAVETLLGRDAEPHRPRPYFWTEQFGHHVKLVGTVSDEEPEVVEGPTGTVLRWRNDEGRIVGAAAVDSGLSIVKLRRLLAA